MASFNPLGNASARPATCDGAKSHAPLTKLKTNFGGGTTLNNGERWRVTLLQLEKNERNRNTNESLRTKSVLYPPQKKRAFSTGERERERVLKGMSLICNWNHTIIYAA